MAVVKGRQYIPTHSGARAGGDWSDYSAPARQRSNLPLSRRRISWREKKKKKMERKWILFFHHFPPPSPCHNYQKSQEKKRENVGGAKVTNGFFNLAKQFQLGRTDVLSALEPFYSTILSFFFPFCATRFNRLGKWEETLKNQPPSSELSWTTTKQLRIVLLMLELSLFFHDLWLLRGRSQTFCSE